MKKTQIRDSEAKQIFWQQHIENWKSSGLSQANYCQKHQINLHTFTSWRSKLKKECVSSILLPVSVAYETYEPVSFSSGISFVVQDHYRINLDIEFNSDTLLKLINILEQR